MHFDHRFMFVTICTWILHIYLFNSMRIWYIFKKKKSLLIAYEHEWGRRSLSAQLIWTIHFVWPIDHFHDWYASTWCDLLHFSLTFYPLLPSTPLILLSLCFCKKYFSFVGLQTHYFFTTILSLIFLHFHFHVYIGL